jgi:hypothetical protein
MMSRKLAGLIIVCAIIGSSAIAIPVSVGSGVNSATVYIEWSDGFCAEFKVKFGSYSFDTTTGLALLQQLDNASSIDFTLTTKDWGWGVAIEGIKYVEGGITHYNPGWTDGENWWHYWNKNTGSTEWMPASVGSDVRIVSNGDMDGWIYGSAGTPIPQPSDFASKIVSYRGPFGPSPYDDPNAVIDKPTTWIKQSATETFACSLVYPAWNTAPDDSKLIVTLDTGAEIIVGFDHKVADDPGNPYGIDFIVFGNSSFQCSGWVEPDTNMDNFYLKNPTSIQAESVTVSVAQDPNGPWYTFSKGPFADGIFPTNSFNWDTDSSKWAEELNWLKPVDPNLSVSDFDGLSVAYAIKLYDGSAGGTGFDLQWLEPNNYHALAIDPETGRRWIKYIKVTSDEFGEVDGFADVACCGDYKHPYPTGDINKDCIVDMEDFAIVAEHWLQCTWNCK